MSFLNCTKSFTKNEDGSSTFTITMDEVMTKCMTSVCNDPEFWIHNAIHNRCRIEGERIYKEEMDKYLEQGAVPANSTKSSLILNYTAPVVTETKESV